MPRESCRMQEVIDMRRILVGLGLVSLTLSFVVAPGNACGDKTLGLNRGVRFQRAYAASHPASILAYMRPNSGVSAAIKDLRLDSALKLAGHKVRVVVEPSAFQEALASDRYDLVVADVA